MRKLEAIGVNTCFQAAFRASAAAGQTRLLCSAQARDEHDLERIATEGSLMTPEQTSKRRTDPLVEEQNNPTTARDSSDQKRSTQRDTKRDRDENAPLDEKLSYNDR
jgi:hypothetical protein